MQPPDRLGEMLRKIIESTKENTSLAGQAKRMLSSLNTGKNVCRLKKALYGLRRAGRPWHARLDGHLRSIGLVPTTREPCMYHKMYEGERLFLLVYVDDLLIASSNTDWINQVKRGLARAFELKDFGLAKYCLGIEIGQTEGEIALSQKGYALDVLRRFNMGKCKPISTPSEPKKRLTKAQQGSIPPERGY